jgi:hypothetical protein
MNAAIVVSTALLLGLPSSLLAQARQDATESPAHTPRSGSNAGTGPEDRGSTGWTGGNREQMKGGATTGAGVSGSDPAADQPQMGSGADLNGPPLRFPANKTPE